MHRVMFGHLPSAGGRAGGPFWRDALPWMLCVTVIVLATVMANVWTLSQAHYFYADDWGWLERAVFPLATDYLRLAPEKLYNDRPAGQMFIEVMYRWFGLDAHPYNVLWLLLHVVNSVLLFTLACRELPRSRALMAALLAGCWYSTLIAVHWVAAIFDLAGATWCLLCLLFYLQSSRESRWSPLWLLGAVCLHVLAIRTKEFALALIVVLASWDFLLIKGQSLRRRLWRLTPHLALTVVYGCIYFVLYEAQRSFVSAGIYRMSVSVPGILDNAAYYLAEAFYVPAGWGDHAERVIGYVLLAGVAGVACSSRKALTAVLSAAALMAPVLLMPNQRNALYLYAPHFLLAFAVCTVAPRNRMITLATGLLVALVIAVPFVSGGWRASRHFYLTIGAYSEQLLGDYISLTDGKPVPMPLTIAVSRTYFDPFSWGQGSVVRMLSGNPDIAVNMVKLSGAHDDACARVSGACMIERDGHLLLQQGLAPAGTTRSPPSPLKSRRNY